MRAEAGPNAHTAFPQRWLSEIAKRVGAWPTKTIGAPDRLGNISIFERLETAPGSPRMAATERLAVQRPNRQSLLRFENLRPSRYARSLSLNQIFTSGTSLEDCSYQKILIDSPPAMGEKHAVNSSIYAAFIIRPASMSASLMLAMPRSKAATRYERSVAGEMM